MATRIQMRRDTTANWTTNGTVIPASGEKCYDTDLKKYKIGDGSTTYASLPYYVSISTNTFTGAQTLPNDGIIITGSSTGTTTLHSDNTSATSYTVNMPAANCTLAPTVSPSFTTPSLGVASATTINKLTLTTPATGSTLTIANGKVLTASNTLTLTATDGSTLAIGTGGTLGTAAYTAATAYAPAAGANTILTVGALTSGSIGSGFGNILTTGTLGCGALTVTGSVSTTNINTITKVGASGYFSFVDTANGNKTGVLAYDNDYWQLKLNSGSMVLQAGPTGTILSTGLSVTGIVTPEADNTRTLGTGALRWSTVYAGTGTINTSDAREKTTVSVLTTNEINAAKQIAKEIGSYKWLSSVAEKGDNARCHIGLTVQKVISILEVNSLDPFAYGFICYDQWDDVVVEHPAIGAVEAQEAVEAAAATFDEDGNELTPAIEGIPAVEAVDGKAAWSETTLAAGDRYSFRMDELNLFIAAGFEARLSALESK